MPRRGDLVFAGLYLPRPLDVATVARFLARVASDRAAPRVVLEVRADEDGTRHLLGCRDTDVHPLRRMLRDSIPGSVLTTPKQGQSEPRVAVDTAGRLRIHPPGLPLLTETAETTTRALLSALATPMTSGEGLVAQVVLGPRRAPRVVPANTPAPDVSLLQLLTSGSPPASAETRNRMKERLSRSGFAATIRLGAASPDPDRRRRFMVSLLSAIATAQGPGVHIDLIRERPGAVNEARLPWRWPLHLAVSELVGLLGLRSGTTTCRASHRRTPSVYGPRPQCTPDLGSSPGVARLATTG